MHPPDAPRTQGKPHAGYGRGTLSSRPRSGGDESAESERYLRGRWASHRRGFYWMAVAAIGCWIVYSLVVSDHGIIRLFELDRQADALAVRLDGLDQQEQEVNWQLHEDGLMQIERTAREKFDMSRPGEIVFYFPTREEGKPRAAAQTETNDPVRPQADDSPAR
jgi:cell division protein FtsB